MSCQLPSQAKHRTPSPHLAVPSVSLRGALRRGALRLGEASDTLPSASHTPCRQLLMRKPLPWGLSGGGGHSAETGSPGSGARSRAVDPQWPHMLTVSTCSQGRRSVTVSSLPWVSGRGGWVSACGTQLRTAMQERRAPLRALLLTSGTFCC